MNLVAISSFSRSTKTAETSDECAAANPVARRCRSVAPDADDAPVVLRSAQGLRAPSARPGPVQDSYGCFSTRGFHLLWLPC